MPGNGDQRHEVQNDANGAVTTEAVPLFGDEFRGDPHATYEWLRRTWGPVAPILLAPGLPAWLVLGYYEVVQTCRAPRLFSRDTRLWADLRDGFVPPGTAVPGELLYRPGLAFAEGDEHARLRQCLTDSLERLDPSRTLRHAQEIAGELIDTFCTAGRADLVGQYARLLPPYVLARIAGASETGTGRLAAALTHADDAAYPGMADAFGRELDALVREKRETPGDDLTSLLLRHPARLSDEEAAWLLHTTLRRGDMPTADLLAGTLRRLVIDREFGGDVAARRLDVDDGVQQVLWVDPPVQNAAPSVSTHGALIGRAEILAGDLMLMSFAAANNDPVLDRGGDDPGLSGRSGRRAHLAWGAGPHRCPAQRMARLIVSAGIEVLLARLSGLRLEGPPASLERRTSPLAPGLAALPVLFEPSAAVNPNPSLWVAEPAFADPDEEPEFVNPFRYKTFWWHHS